MTKKLHYWDAISWRWIRHAWVYTPGNQASGWQPLIGISAFDGANWQQSYPTPPGALYNIIVTPSTATVYPTNTQQFQAAGYDVDGIPVVISPTWTINTITDSIGYEGLFTAGYDAGYCTVYASVGAIQGTALVTVPF